MCACMRPRLRSWASDLWRRPCRRAAVLRGLSRMPLLHASCGGRCCARGGACSPSRLRAPWGCCSCHCGTRAVAGWVAPPPFCAAASACHTQRGALSLLSRPLSLLLGTDWGGGGGRRRGGPLARACAWVSPLSERVSAAHTQGASAAASRYRLAGFSGSPRGSGHVEPSAGGRTEAEGRRAEARERA